jgi:hypothetical protein
LKNLHIVFQVKCVWKTKCSSGEVEWGGKGTVGENRASMGTERLWKEMVQENKSRWWWNASPNPVYH